MESIEDQQRTLNNNGGLSVDLAQPPVPSGATASRPATAQQLSDVEKQMTGFERSTVRWAKIAVGMSGLAAFFVCAQWYEMHTGGRDTHELAVAAQAQVEKMKSMSDAADKIREAAEGMVKEEQRMADNSQKVLDASNRQSKQALDATIAQFREDQRAWVAASDVSVEGIEVDAIPKAKVFWTNSGKTFAKKVAPSIHFRLIGSLLGTEEDLNKATRLGVNTLPTISIGAIGPQNKSSSVLGYDHKLSEVEKSDASRSYTYFWGELSYKDVFSRVHSTEFCLYRYGIVGDFLQCPFHNDAN